METVGLAFKAGALGGMGMRWGRRLGGAVPLSPVCCPTCPSPVETGSRSDRGSTLPEAQVLK